MITRRSLAWLAGMACLALLISLLTSRYHLRLLTNIGIDTIAAVGMSLIFGQVGQMSMGQAAFFGLGGYTAGLVAVSLKWSALFGLAGAIAVPAILAFPIGWIVLRLTGFYLAMAALALNSIVIAALSQIELGPAGVNGIPGIPPLQFGPLNLENQHAFAAFVWILALATLAFSDNLLRSRVGRALRAIRGSEDAAAVTGISVTRYKLMIFVFGCGLAGLGGALSAHYNSYVGPDSAALSFSIFLLVAVVVGGRGSIWGAPLGVAALMLLVEGVSKYGRYELVAYGILLTFALMVFPTGIVGLLDGLRVRLANRFGSRRIEGGKAARP
jgi:branched-chain amino acid transport system permease protein